MNIALKTIIEINIILYVTSLMNPKKVYTVSTKYYKFYNSQYMKIILLNSAEAMISVNLL